MIVFTLPRTSRGRALLVFSLLLACYGYFFPTLNNWGSNSRMDLTYALGDQGSIRIDDYHLNTGDKAYFNGHYYTEKSIGPSLLAVPVYLLFRGAMQVTPLARLAAGNKGPGALPTLDEVYQKYHLPVPGTPGAGHPAIYHAMALVVVTFFSVAVLSALLGTVVYLAAARFATRPDDAVWLALAFGLGTPAFPYSNQLYQHQAGAFGAFVGFFVLWRVVDRDVSRRWLWVVGVLFGYAMASEYVLAPIVALVVLWAAPALQPRRDLLRIAAGAAPWIVATAIYDVAAFGTPLPVGYRYSAFAGAFESGLFGFSAPSWDSFYLLTFSPYRGLFVLSPFLLLALPGLHGMRRDARTRQLALVLLTIAVAFLVYNASYWESTGGDSVGPRYLVPLLPFLTLPIVFVQNRARRAWQKAGIAAVFAVSIAEVWTVSLAGQSFPPEAVQRPLLDYALPLVRTGQLRFSVGTLLGLRGLAAVLPLALLLTAIVTCIRRVERLWFRRAAVVEVG